MYPFFMIKKISLINNDYYSDYSFIYIFNICRKISKIKNIHNRHKV